MLAVLVWPALAQAPAELRVALVIGNSAYPRAPLANPANDARAMAAALQQRGFAVVELRDGDRAQMFAAISDLQERLRGKQGVALLYYAGHGMQLEWRNYMLPVNASPSSAADVTQQAIEVQSVLDAFRRAGTRMNIVILDACRDNPFGASSSAKGLAQMDAPPGTLLAFATAPGNVAEDGSAGSRNGLYTRYLLEGLVQPNAKLEDVFKRVRWQVRQESQGRQVPWESTSLEDDFYFDPSVKVVRLDDAERARKAEAELKEQNAEWTRIRTGGSADDLYAFLKKYPNGVLSEQAQFRLDQLQRATAQPQVPADGVVALPSGTRRFEVGDEDVFDRIDGFTKAVTRVRLVVTKATDVEVEINHGSVLRDQTGMTIANRNGRKDPGFLSEPAELALGKRWRNVFTNLAPDGGLRTNYYEHKVTALEEVTVPAGRFLAYKVERHGAGRGPGIFLVLTGTAWIDPATMRTVKSEVLNRSNGKIVLYDTDVLVSRKLVPR